MFFMRFFSLVLLETVLNGSFAPIWHFFHSMAGLKAAEKYHNNATTELAINVTKILVSANHEFVESVWSSLNWRDFTGYCFVSLLGEWYNCEDLPNECNVVSLAALSSLLIILGNEAVWHCFFTFLGFPLMHLCLMHFQIYSFNLVSSELRMSGLTHSNIFLLCVLVSFLLISVIG